MSDIFGWDHEREIKARISNEIHEIYEEFLAKSCRSKNSASRAALASEMNERIQQICAAEIKRMEAGYEPA